MFFGVWWFVFFFKMLTVTLRWLIKQSASNADFSP